MARFLAALVLLMPAWAASAQTLQTLSFTEDPSPTLNPERGFYDYCVPMSAAAPEPLDLGSCGNDGPSGTRLLFRYFDIGAFRDAPISAAYLARMASDFEIIREAGFKLVPRFAYETDPLNLTPPHGDATKARVLEHIAQVGPVLAANADVILSVQAGFIGLWGEWYFTDHFVADPFHPGTITDADFRDRREVVDALLAAMPASRAVQIRVPYQKMEMLGTDAPLTDADAHDGSPRARVAHHNDCFLTDPFDIGTYREGQVAEDRAYLAAETRNLIVGGETCNPEFGDGPHRFACDAAIADMAEFHWTYLNRDYFDGPTCPDGSDDVWIKGQCFEEIQARLGYRLVLDGGSVPSAVRPGGAFPFSLALDNDGFAALVNERPVQLVLRGAGGTFTVTLPDDPRRWYSGDIDLSAALGVGDVPTGTYELYLSLPDAAPALSGVSEYAVRTSNVGTWDDTLGMNRLATVTVSASAPGPAYTGSLWFGDAIVSSETGPAERMQVSVAPNPFVDVLEIRVADGDPGSVRVEVVDGLGRVVSATSVETATGTVDVSVDAQAFPPGVYFVRVWQPGRSADGVVISAVRGTR